MKKKITFLGIETSCDETAAAVIQENDDGTAKILSNIVSSQIKEHEKFGGVVPEVAARSHIENIDFIINKAMKESELAIANVDGVAATAGPGLMVCLTVGLNVGKSIAAFANKPFVAHNIISCLDQRDTQHSPTSSRMMSATTSSGRVCQPIDQHLRALCRNLIIEERSAMVNDKGAVVVGIMVIAVITAMAMASTNINTMTNSNDHSKL